MALAAVVAVAAVGALLFEAFSGGKPGKSKGPTPTPTPGKPGLGTPGVDFFPPAGDKKQPKPAAHDPRIDANMPAALAAVTIAMLDNPTTSAAALHAAATAAELAGYPIAAAALHHAAEDREITPEENPPPGMPTGPSASSLAADFADMPDPPRSEVMSALATSLDPDFLERQADEADASGYGVIADAFRAKAEMIRASGGGMAPQIPGMVFDKPGKMQPGEPAHVDVPGAGPQQVQAALAATAAANQALDNANAHPGDAQLAFLAAQLQAAALMQQIAVNQALAAAGEPPIAFPVYQGGGGGGQGGGSWASS